MSDKNENLSNYHQNKERGENKVVTDCYESDKTSNKT